MAHETGLSGPDFSPGIAISDLAENEPVLGHLGGKPVVVVRRGADTFAVGAKCTMQP